MKKLLVAIILAFGLLSANAQTDVVGKKYIYTNQKTFILKPGGSEMLKFY